MISLHALYKECCYEGKDGVELRQSGIDHGVGLYVVTLSHTPDTIGTNHALTDGREEAYKTYAQTNAKPKCGVLCNLPVVKQVAEESVQTLCSWHS
jgi:hypothetical protein